MEWGDVQVFLAVARHGSLGSAARRLALTQPTVGRRITALEAEVGHALFQRSHTGMVLTEEGQSVLSAAERMEEEALAFQRRLVGGERQISGLLRITASDWFGSYFLGPVLGEFSLLHPEVEIELLTDARIYDLSRREADIAFRITPFESPDIVSRRFVQVDYALYGAAGCLPESLDEDMRVITMDAAFGGMPDVAWMRTSMPNARVVFRSNSREVQARACAQGVGLAVLPVKLAEHFPSLAAIAVAEQPPSRQTWVGYHQDLRRLGRLRELLGYLDSNLVSDGNLSRSSGEG